MAPRRPRPLTKLSLSLLFGMAAGLVAFVAFGAASAYLSIAKTDVILPGVRVGETRVGGMTREEAAHTIEAAWQASTPIIRLSTLDRSWFLSPKELGITIDGHASAARAVAVGREGGNASQALLDGIEVPPVVTVAPEVALRTLELWAIFVNVPPQDATFRIEGIQVITLPARPGQALDVEATLNTLKASPERVLEDGNLPLTINPVAPRLTNVSVITDRVSQLLSNPLIIHAYDPISDEVLSWSASPETTASWLGVTQTADGPLVSVAEDKITAFVNDQNGRLAGGQYVDVAESAKLIADAINADQIPTLRVRHSPTTYVVQSGDTMVRVGWKTGIPFWRVVQANPGLEARSLWPGMEVAIPSKDELLPLPIAPDKRIVVSISQQRLWTFENRQQTREYVISTGIERSPTQPGVFQVQTHDLNAYASVWDLWMPHFLGIYEAWPGFMNGFHGLPVLASGQRLWANVLGQPASYGCIILDLDDAEALYAWAEDGVVVEIRE